MKYILFIAFLALVGCKKEPNTVTSNSNEPILLKIEIVDKDGKVLESPVILAR